MENLLARFSATLGSADTEIVSDVQAYLAWQRGRRGDFTPGETDIFELRAYLLGIRVATGEVDSAAFGRQVASLRQFYAWAEAEGIIAASPFEELDLDGGPPTSPPAQAQPGAPTSQAREIGRLRALNRLASDLNRSAEIQEILDATLQTLVEVMELRTAWVSLLTAAGFARYTAKLCSSTSFTLAAAHGLPPGLVQEKYRHLCQAPDCRCQTLLRDGRLTHAVNILECTRLRRLADESGDTGGLRFHATVPIILHDQPLGVLNVATKDWQTLTAPDLQLLSAAGAQIALALERARLYEMTRSQQARLEQELEMARTVQACLLPGQLPAIPGFDLAAGWQAAREVAGDFYDLFPLAGGRWGVVVADVCDKGAPAALYMVLARSLIRAEAESLLSPAETLTRVNQALYTQCSASMFVTVFYAIINPTAFSLTYASAGHEGPILRSSPVPAKVEQLPGGGLPLGMFSQVTLTDTIVRFAPGDLLVAYTDGVTETFNASREMFGEERLLQIIRRSSPASARALVDAVVAEVTNFAGDAPQSDDITLVTIRRQPG